ncbi:hypothetical protein L1987_02709 [Smallanthus sonchifolius]|uniref:Uncharacterized protein n=1 Tax=Smallanthus sonchifolius TaxID=185202 RepID=A0ACB9K8T1_9ASTR|nr:hypothetical protein L1987_02709 [Smallanthus sonchifolius]
MPGRGTMSKVHLMYEYQLAGVHEEQLAVWKVLDGVAFNNGGTEKEEEVARFDEGTFQLAHHWFSLDKNGKKCHVISARAIVEMVRKMDKLSLPESRFGEAIQCDSWKLCINSIIQSQLVSSSTTYAAYIVYKLPKNQSGFEVPMLVVDTLLSSDNNWYINLASPQTPIIRSKANQNTHNTLKGRKMKGLPQKRNDGWMEVQIWEFQTATATKMIPMCLKLATCGDKMLSGLIIHAFEFRPI